MTREKILVVEDESIIAKDIQNRLKKFGYIVPVIASSGEEAINKAAETCPDLVLMDINLKGKIDGVEAAKQIRTYFNIPIIYLTAYADDRTLERAKITEPSGYLIKPFKERELYTTIEMALSKHQIEIRKNLAKEKELSDLRSRLITTVSHEFRTPLTVISTSVGLLRDYSHKLTEDKKRKYLTNIQTSVEHITHLLEDVLVINRAETKELEFNPAPLDLPHFCRDLLEELRINIDINHQIVLQTCDANSLSNAGEDTNACMDKNLLRQLLSNLLSNAVKFSHPGKNVYFNLAFQDGTAVFQVSDEGIGIPLEEQQNLFEPFYRAKNVGNIPGLGLGLSVVKKCVDLHKGKITVVCEPGGNTTFTVSIPLS